MNYLRKTEHGDWPGRGPGTPGAEDPGVRVVRHSVPSLASDSHLVRCSWTMIISRSIDLEISSCP